MWLDTKWWTDSEPESLAVDRNDVPANDDVECDSHDRTMNGDDLVGYDSVDGNKPAGEILEVQNRDEGTKESDESQGK